jgi:hypothetical protein
MVAQLVTHPKNKHYMTDTKKRTRAPKKQTVAQVKEHISHLSLEDKIIVLGFLKTAIGDEKKWFESQISLIPVTL